MAVNIIQGTDRVFTMRIVRKSNQEPYDLTGLTADDLSLKLPGDEADFSLSLTANANGSVLTMPSPLGGKISVSLSDVDTALLKSGDSQNMELTIKEGAGPDFDISIVQFEGLLNVKTTVLPE